MRSRLLLVCVCLFAWLRPAAAAAEPPKLRLSEVQDIAPESHRAELTLDPDKDRFSGTIRIQIKINRPTQIIWLNANQIEVQEASVSVAGKPWPAAVVPGGEYYLGLQLDSAAPAGRAEIYIRYTGKVRQSDTSGVFRTEDGGNHYILTQFEDTDARDAFPCFDEPSYKAPWQLTLRIPAQDHAVSNTPVSSQTTDGGMRTVVFGETKPLPSYLIAFGVGPFEFVDAGIAGKKRVPVRIVTPKGRAGEAKYAAEVTATILTRLEEYFGIPFPYDKSDQVAVPVTVGFGAMENPGMVTYGQAILLAKPETDTIARQRSYATVAAHELSHQWFGDFVTTAWWNDIWLNEAFATWMEQKVIAEWKPEWNSRVNDVSSKLGAAEQDSLASARKIRQEIESKDDIANAFDDITYNKGAAVIGMFESWMGEEAFRKGVQGYLRQYAFRTSTSGEFLDALSTAAKQDVSGAFSTFLNQPGVPSVSVTLECGAKRPTLHLEQSRYVPIGSKAATDEVWKLPVCVRYGEGKADRECTLMSTQKMEWPLRAKSCPAWVEANDNAKGYYRVEYQGGLLSALTTGDVVRRLNAAERVDLIGNLQAMASGGKLPVADALRLAETFRNDPIRQVVQGSLNVALSAERHLAPENLRANYERFLQKNYGDLARKLGWVGQPGDSDDVRLLRSSVLPAVAGPGGDRELARQAGALAEKWLQDRKSVPPDIVNGVLSTAARYGGRDLYQRFLAEFQKSSDRKDQQVLLGALVSFRDPALLEIGMREVASGRIRLADGFLLLLAGQGARATAKTAFEFVTSNFDQITKGNPSIFGFSVGATLPNVGGGFCDPQSRKELEDFFKPKAGKFDGAPRNLAHVLESIDLCTARVAAQGAGVAEFLRSY